MPGQGPAADITMTIAAEDFEKLQEDPQTNGMALFNEGKMIIQGNAMLGMKLGKLFTLGPSWTRSSQARRFIAPPPGAFHPPAGVLNLNLEPKV